MFNNDVRLNALYNQPVSINNQLGQVSKNNVLGRTYLQEIKETYGNKYVIRKMANIQDNERVTTLGKGYGTLHDYQIF